MMRIITGRARGIQLVTLEGDMTRPTSERAKMAIFSSLQFELEGRRVLDLFAGSGQLGLEALSRGAKKATFSDSSRDAIDIVMKNAKKSAWATALFLHIRKMKAKPFARALSVCTHIRGLTICSGIFRKARWAFRKEPKIWMKRCPCIIWRKTCGNAAHLLSVFVLNDNQFLNGRCPDR